MTLSVSTECPSCSYRIATPYTALGLQIACPKCSGDVVPTVVRGSTFPNTGCHIRYHDFVELISDPNTQGPLSTMLVGWFGHIICGAHTETEIMSSSGAVLDLYQVHLQIQDDDTKRGELYNFAMSIWR